MKSHRLAEANKAVKEAISVNETEEAELAVVILQDDTVKEVDLRDIEFIKSENFGGSGSGAGGSKNVM